MPTAKTLFDSLVGQLQGYRPEEARAIVFLLLEHYLLLRRTDVVAGKPLPATPPQPDWQDLIDRLNRHEPVQHLIGTTEFCGLEFQVSPAVLIPRPETEELIRLIVRDFADDPDQESPKSLNILDIGTGSGCIAVTLARFLPHASVAAWDVSDEALELARQNAQALQADVAFERRDILNVGDEPRRFECVVSNPPYVTWSEAEEMEPNVLRYEPHLALFVEDNDPLLFYKAVADFGKKHLSQNGACYVEINERFGAETQRVFEERGYHQVQIFKDIHGKERFVKAINN